jgi:enamine deaminase RidA (YjgF/YER057c/UK114 family)
MRDPRPEALPQGCVEKCRDGSALLFVSGRIAEGATLAEQSRGVFETLAALLEAHGASLADVINIRTYLTDITELEEYGAVRREFLTGTPPTSMTFEVSRPPGDVRPTAPLAAARSR